MVALTHFNFHRQFVAVPLGSSIFYKQFTTRNKTYNIISMIIKRRFLKSKAIVELTTLGQPLTQVRAFISLGINLFKYSAGAVFLDIILIAT